jgi:hypothetical protein
MTTNIPHSCETAVVTLTCPRPRRVGRTCRDDRRQRDDDRRRVSTEVQSFGRVFAPVTTTPAVCWSTRSPKTSARSSSCRACSSGLLFLALLHIWGKDAPPRHREAVIFPCCPREEIPDGLSGGLSRTRMARRSLV